MTILTDRIMTLIDSKYTIVVMIIIEVILSFLVLITGHGLLASLAPFGVGSIASGIIITILLFDYRNNIRPIFQDDYYSEHRFVIRVIRFWISLIVISIFIVMLMAR